MQDYENLSDGQQQNQNYDKTWIEMQMRGI